MKSAALRITSAGGRTYVLGDPMHVYEGPMHIGTVMSVQAAPGGHDLLLENFVPTNAARYDRTKVGPLVLAEVLSFVVQNFPSVHTIGITLARNITGYEAQGLRLAKVRTDLLASVGAEQVVAVPRPTASLPGHFAVRAVWIYNERNCAALATALAFQREGYAARRKAAAQAAGRRSIFAWLGGKLRRPKS